MFRLCTIPTGHIGTKTKKRIDVEKLVRLVGVKDNIYPLDFDTVVDVAVAIELVWAIPPRREEAPKAVPLSKKRRRHSRGSDKMDYDA